MYKEHRIIFRTSLFVFSLALMFCCGVRAESAGSESANRHVKTVDIIDAVYLPGIDRIFVVGRNGMAGLAEVGDGTLNIQLLDSVTGEDFTVVAQLSEQEALIGSSRGRMYHFGPDGIKEVAALSEFDEPVMDIAVTEGKIWAVGARGLIATSVDGTQWQAMEITGIKQPPLVIPDSYVGELYFGIANVNVDTVVFQATVDGQPLVADEDYEFYADEGFLLLSHALDSGQESSISFSFEPGPPFRRGDVSWNTVIVDGDDVIIAGEFGLVLQSGDGGETWVRRQGLVSKVEPQLPYWLTGVGSGQYILLAGAAGVVSESRDRGETWNSLDRPSKEGVFGVTVSDEGEPIVLGAVGLVGNYSNGSWTIGDRTQLQLQSWLKTPVKMPDGSLLALGGRSTVIRYQSGRWQRLEVSID